MYGIIPRTDLPRLYLIASSVTPTLNWKPKKYEAVGCCTLKMVLRYSNSLCSNSLE